MSPVQKPRGARVSRILNGLASPGPTSLDQTLFEKLWQSLVKIEVSFRFEECPGEFQGQRGILALMRSGDP